MKITAFGASNSKNSINKKLALYTASLIENAEVNLLDLNDYEMPIYSEDHEKENGIPEKVKLFVKNFADTNLIIISFAEHNGTYTTAFKNILDWSTRVKRGFLNKKPMFILSASPGPRGAISVLNTAISSMPHFDGEVKAHYSFPNFYENFDVEKNIVVNNQINADLKNLIKDLLATLEDKK